MYSGSIMQANRYYNERTANHKYQKNKIHQPVSVSTHTAKSHLVLVTNLCSRSTFTGLQERQNLLFFPFFGDFFSGKDQQVACTSSSSGLKKVWPLMRLDRDAVIHNLREGRVEHPLVLLDLGG
jgi:hypothetical protein